MLTATEFFVIVVQIAIINIQCVPAMRQIRIDPLFSKMQSSVTKKVIMQDDRMVKITRVIRFQLVRDIREYQRNVERTT